MRRRGASEPGELQRYWREEITFSICSLCHLLKHRNLGRRASGTAVMTSYLLEVRRQLVGGEKRGLGAPVDLVEHADHKQRHDEADDQRAQEVQKDEPPGGHTCPAAQTQISRHLVHLRCASGASKVCDHRRYLLSACRAAG